MTRAPAFEKWRGTTAGRPLSALRRRTPFAALAFGLLFTTVAAEAAPAAEKAVDAPAAWVFGYFRQRYESRVEIDADGTLRNVPLPDPMKEERLHLALSTDGRNWTPLNGGHPTWNQWLRDPFFQRGPDGLWRLVATGGATRSATAGDGPTCLYAVSRDLVTWEEVRSLTPMSGVRDKEGRRPGNLWAPEWFFDQKAGDFVLLWSSSFEKEGWRRSRLWFSRTRDWKNFTPARPLFEPPYSVIDGTLAERDGTYYLFHKEEEFGAKTGERRAIRVATAGHLEGPYRIHEGPLNRGQIVPTITEGPSVMRDPQKPGWLLLYDYCMSGAYGLSSSEDLLRWTAEKTIRFPADARHGCVAPLDAADVARLRAAFGRSE